MNEPLLRPATPDDLEFIAKNLRAEDAEEVWVSSGLTAGEALAFTIRDGQSFVVEHNGELVCACGYVDATSEQTRFIWMLGTTGLDKYPLTFVRFFRKVLEDWKQPGWTYSNTVYEKNTRHIKLLKSLGATFTPHRKNFLRFTI